MRMLDCTAENPVNIRPLRGLKLVQPLPLESSLEAAVLDSPAYQRYSERRSREGHG